MRKGFLCISRHRRGRDAVDSGDLTPDHHSMALDVAHDGLTQGISMNGVPGGLCQCECCDCNEQRFSYVAQHTTRKRR